MLHVPADACYASVTSDREAAISIEKGPEYLLCMGQYLRNPL